MNSHRASERVRSASVERERHFSLAERMVKRRYVFHIAGYDPIGSAWYGVFKRKLTTFAQTWNVSSVLSNLEPRSPNANPRWTVISSATNWQVETTYEQLLWDDIVSSDFARPLSSRRRRGAIPLPVIWSSSTRIANL
jgi:hypothetical protein